MSNASDWLIEYKLARRACRLKMGAEYYVDRLSGLEDKEIIEKFQKTLKRNGRITTDVRKAIAEFDEWLSLLKGQRASGEIISKDLSMFLSYKYSYFNDIPNLSRICLQQLLLLRNFFQNNFKDLPTGTKDIRDIAFLLSMNLKKFESLDWLVHLIFYFEKNNKKDKINFSVSERKLLFKFSQIIKIESNYNKGILHNTGGFITKEKFKIINHSTLINEYLKRYAKTGIPKNRRSRRGGDGEGYMFDRRPTDVLIFLTNNFDDLVLILSRLSVPQKCFVLSPETRSMSSLIKKKKNKIIQLSTKFLSIKDSKVKL